MKRVLFIAYYFPPVGGAGVQRSVKFVKYLPELDYGPLVLTTRGEATGRWSPRDASLSNEVPTQVRVFRTGPVCLTKWENRWGRRLREMLGLSSQFARQWQKAVLQTGTLICQEERPDLIFISMSPFEGALAASSLARQFGIPWVADLRDPWALDEMQLHWSCFHRKLEQQRMHVALRDAALVIMNTPEAADRLVRAFPDFQRKRVVHITNGFDAADFEGCKHRPDPAWFTIVHAGYLHTDIGLHLRRKRRIYEALGQVVPGVDFLTRSHYFLLQALERWLAADPGLKGKIRLILAGSLTEEDKLLVKSSGVSDIVEFTGYLSHKETVKLLINADLLFLPMHNLPPGRRATIVPGKTYEYMAAGRPILAAVPEGDARDFVTEAGTGLVCAPDDVSAMVRILQTQYDAWRRRHQTVALNKAFVDHFERRHLTELLAKEFNRVLRSWAGRMGSSASNIPVPQGIR